MKATGILVALAGSGLALAVAKLAGFASAIDAALPFWVLLASSAGAIAISDSAAQRTALVIPAFLGAAIAIPADPARHLVYGILLAAALAIVLIDVARDGALPRGRAIALAILVVATRAFPFEAGTMVPVFFLAIGTAALLVAVGDERGVPLTPTFLILAIALVTPLVPWDAALIPLTMGFAFFAVRGPGRPQAAPAIATAAVSLVLAFLVGKWMAAAVAILFAARWSVTIIRARNEPAQRVPAAMIAIPALTASRAAGAIAGVGFAPGALFAPAEWWQRVAAALLFALSLLARPHPALLVALMALLVLAARTGDGARCAQPRVAAIPGALLFGAIALSAWSGAVAASFPLFIDRQLWVPFAILSAGALAWSGRLAGPRWGETEAGAGSRVHTVAASLLGAASFLLFVLLLPKEPVHVEPVLTSIVSGESFVLEPPLASGAIDVVISGANVSGIAAGAVLGRLDVVDAHGAAFAQPIRAGEIADWGAFRSGDLFRTRNPLPRIPGWTIHGEGREAALRGEGRLRVRLERPIGRMIVTAGGALPPGARLQIERMEVEPR